MSVARDVTSDNPVTYGRQAHVLFADVDIHSRTMILRVDAARLGFAPGKPVAFDAVVVMVPGIDDVRGGDPKARKGYDALPDDGWTDSNVPGPGRVSFDETVVPAFESWRRAATARSGASTAVGLPAGGASTAPWQMLAVYPLNAPGEGDFETFEVVIGTAPTAPPTVAPTSTPRPTSTPGPSPTEGPTATATATLAGETRVIYLPVARR